MEIEFHNLEELKQRVMPALRLRKREFKKNNQSVTEEELWNYLKDNYWKKSHQLSLSQMVDDILNQKIEL